MTRRLPMADWPWWMWPAGIAGGAAVLGVFVVVCRVVSRLAEGSWNPSKNDEESQ